MLSIANEVDSLIFRCVCFVCDTKYVFSTSRPLQNLCGDSFLNDPLHPQQQSTGIGLGSPTYSLQMIVSYFTRLLRQNVRGLWSFWLSMREDLAKQIIKRRQTFSLTQILHTHSKLRSNIFWVFWLYANMKNIWGYQLRWVEPKKKNLCLFERERVEEVTRLESSYQVNYSSNTNIYHELFQAP